MSVHVAEAATTAALEIVFGQFLYIVRDVRGNIKMFRSLLERLESTFNRVEPVVKEINKFSEELDRNDLGRIVELIETLKGLVEKCLNIHKCNLYKKYTHAKKLSKLDESISREFQIFLPLMHARDGRETLYDVQGLREDVHGLREDVHRALLHRLSGAVEIRPDIFAVPEAPDFVLGSGLEESLKQLKSQLLEEGALKMVVTAPGGSGKTTLVTKLCHDAAIEGKFSSIFFVPVSKSPNLMEIVQKMAKQKGFEATQIEIDDDAIHVLRKLLKIVGEHPVLLVLDDVWPESKSMLEKFVVKLTADYKIVVTSRCEFPAFGPTHRLKPLSDKEAMKLFHHCADIEDKKKGIPDDEVVEKIVRKCKGLPLALKVVAKSLRGLDPSYWREKLLGWSEGQSLFDSDSEVLDCLKKSLDDLEGDPSVKERFMDLSSFPEDRKIPATSLIDMWVEMYKLDFEGVHAIADLHRLASRSLADIVVTKGDSNEDDNCYSIHYVLQHDLLRELAILECNRGEVKERKRLLLGITGNTFPDWCNDQRQQPLSASLVSISTDGTFLSSWPSLEFPEIQVLVLNFQTKSNNKSYTLPGFIEKSNKLKVLIVTNHSFIPAELNNFNMIASLSNLKRIRFERVTVPLMTMESLQFNNLQKLSFFMCNIDQASTSDDTQVFKAMPNLLELNIDYCINLVALPNYICGCVHLRKLSITNCHNFSTLPQQIENFANLEVLRLNSCTSLLQLPDTIGNLKSLTFLNISDCLNLKMLPEKISQLVKLKKLNMKGCLKLSELPSSFGNLKNLKKVFCDEEKASMWKSLKNSLAFLDIEVSEEDANLDWLDE